MLENFIFLNYFIIIIIMHKMKKNNCIYKTFKSFLKFIIIFY